MPTQWGLFEDSPEKLLQEVRKARLKREQEESVTILAEARKLYEQGKLDEAERQAHRAERLHGPYSFWDLGDRPQKLLVEIDTAKTKSLTPKLPAPPVAVAKKEAEKKTPEKSATGMVVAQSNLPPPVWPETKQPDSSVKQPDKSVTRVASQNTPPPVRRPAKLIPVTLPGRRHRSRAPTRKSRQRPCLPRRGSSRRMASLVEARQKALEAQRLAPTFGPG